MNNYFKQRDNDVCPLNSKPIHTTGGKWYAYPMPCLLDLKKRLGKMDIPTFCEYLSQHWSTRYNCTVRCKHQSSNRRLKK